MTERHQQSSAASDYLLIATKVEHWGFDVLSEADHKIARDVAVKALRSAAIPDDAQPAPDQQHLRVLRDLAIAADAAELMMRPYYPGEAASLRTKVTAAKELTDRSICKTCWGHGWIDDDNGGHTCADCASQPSPAATVTDERAFDLARRISDHLTTEEAAIAIMEYATDAIEAERAFWRSSAGSERPVGYNQLANFAELKLLIDEYDPSNSDWDFRKGVLLDILVRLWPTTVLKVPQAAPDREAVAKIIDPAPWGSPWSYPRDWEGPEDVEAARQRAFAKADAILALTRSNRESGN